VVDPEAPLVAGAPPVDPFTPPLLVVVLLPVSFELLHAKRSGAMNAAVSIGEFLPRFVHMGASISAMQRIRTPRKSARNEYRAVRFAQE
jgi:hypothetical protein